MSREEFAWAVIAWANVLSDVLPWIALAGVAFIFYRLGRKR